MKYQLLIWIFLLPAMSNSAANEMIDEVNSFKADVTALNRTYTIKESYEYYQRFTTFYKSWEERLTSIDFEQLSRDGKADYISLKNLINRENYQLQSDFTEFKEVATVVDFADDIYTFIQERRRGKRPDAENLSKVLSKSHKDIDQKITALKNKPFKDWIQARKAASVITSLEGTLKEAYGFYFGYDPQFTWWVEKPYELLIDKLRKYHEFLLQNYSSENIKDDGSGIIGKPIGKDALTKQLQLEFIPYSPNELIAIAQKQFDWCKTEMINASKEMGYGTNWKAAMEHVKNTYVQPGDQPDMINRLTDQSIEFIEKRDLITLPDLAKETWGMKMMTAKRQEFNPFFTGGWDITISYPTLEMNQESKMMSMRGNNPNFSFPTVQHELLPGHNLQFYMNARNKNYRQAFYTPFWMEGWALYWEIALWEKGFAQTPEQKMGMLFWRIHRCARIIFSLKYHLNEMTPQQCIDMLVDDVGHEYANAEAEVRRSFTGIRGPLYQLAYMTGGLQFYALKNELIDQGWTEKQFHDRVLKENMMSVEVLRLLLADKPLKKNYKTNWKFPTEFK